MSQRDLPPRRTFAGVFDLRVEGDENAHGVGQSNDAIGGFYGVGWYEYFKDAETGQVYRVHCSDGVNGGKGAHSDTDENWLNAIHYAIVARCHKEAKSGATEIRISRNERVVMQGFDHRFWLKSSEGACDGQQSNDGLEGGLVGHCLGVPVICDMDQEDNFSPRPTEPQTAEE